MDTQKLRILLILTCGLLTLVGMLILMGVLSGGSSVILAQSDSNYDVSLTDIDCSNNCTSSRLFQHIVQDSEIANQDGNWGVLDVDASETYTNVVYLPLIMKPRYPLFVGLQLRWDGNGYIRGSQYENVGSHVQKECNGMTDDDTIKCHSYSWYDPNPYDWDPDEWDAYYSISTGDFKSSSVPSDPSWKWGYPWILPYDVQFSDGQTVYVDGQAFSVSGPYSGYTAFGQAVRYWKLVNKNKFLYWDGGGDWTQYVHSGNATLWYDAGHTRLLLHDDVLRRYYYQDQQTNDTVQYITNLTSTNAFSDDEVALEGLVHSTPPNSHFGRLRKDAAERNSMHVPGFLSQQSLE